jgi:TolB-like protein/Tfp pilus assembly protein PilF
MSGSANSIFLSYASEDAMAAEKICQALRAAGVEVWFDQKELRGGDVWDQQIRQRIHDCALFVPVISAHTEHRKEGYFRREWRLAVERTHDMSDRSLFVVPVVIDGTREKGADVPETFLRVQWTHLPGGDTPPAFCERIQALTDGAGALEDPPASPRATPSQSPARRARTWITVSVATLAVALIIGWSGWWLMRPKAPLLTASGHVATFSPPPHSIAVLPFVNMSGDQEQEYFSEGLTEELLNSLARVSELQVAARTSSFSFQGQHPDIVTVAHRLNVGAVLEGSVRRSAHTVRITAQLVNGVTGYHLWSQTYDRDLGDVLKLQTEIANDVASALKVTLLGDVTARVELGGTRNPAAFDAYLRAMKKVAESQNEQDVQAAVAGYTDSIRLDPRYALAYSSRSIALTDLARNWSKGSSVHDYNHKAEADARRAIALAPELAEAHMALATVLSDGLRFEEAQSEFERALALGSGNAQVLRNYGVFTAYMGHTAQGIAGARRAVQLDPLNFDAHYSLGVALIFAHRFDDAINAFKDAIALAPNDGFLDAWLGFAYYWAGDALSASKACQAADISNKAICLSLAYKKLGRQAEAEALLAGLQKEWGDDGAVFYSLIYSEWGDKARALANLETALRTRQPYLVYVKSNVGFDPLRSEPRFQAIQAALNFPE